MYSLILLSQPPINYNFQTKQLLFSAGQIRSRNRELNVCLIQAPGKPVVL